MIFSWSRRRKTTMIKCCATCEYIRFEDIDQGYVCVNSDSDYCDDWEEK